MKPDIAPQNNLVSKYIAKYSQKPHGPHDGTPIQSTFTLGKHTKCRRQANKDRMEDLQNVGWPLELTVAEANPSRNLVS